MKLRTRIFTLVGGLFLSSFIVSTALEIFFSRQAATRTNTILDANLKSYEIKRQLEVSNYLKEKLDKLLALIDGTLDRTKTVQLWNYFFSPTDINVQTNLWLTSALFLMSNKTIDLIQTEINNKLTSQIVIDGPPPYRVLTLDFMDELKLCVIDPQIPSQKMRGPFIGIPYNYDVQILPEVLGQSSTESTPVSPVNHYLLFNPEQILNLDPKVLYEKIKLFEEISISDPKSYPMNIIEFVEMKKALPRLIDAIAQAKSYLLANPGLYQYITQKKQTWMEDQYHNLYDATPGINQVYGEKENIMVRFSQISMIWQYASLIATGLTDFTINTSSPLGLATINPRTKQGFGIMAEDVMGTKPVEMLSPSIYRVNERIFLGNTTTLELNSPSGISQTVLTIGLDLRDIFKGLSIVTERNMLLVVNQQVIAAADIKGQPIEVNPADFPIGEITKNTSGIYKNPEGKEYIYLTAKLFPNQDVYFILYRLKSIEFGFIDRVTDSLNQLENHLTIQSVFITILTLIVAAFIISRLSSYITKPIVILAKNTKEVQEGHLDEVDLPPIDDQSHDEIEELYQSFSDMVTGLREKERVKGILNKVVSPKIANKILEGNVTLGGEEKIVTVLFADIRDFTELTEQMKPTELIQILNSFMTKLSDVIDRHNGVIDKYVGDEVMALFGAPIAELNSASSAINCALEMMQEVNRWNEERKKLGLFPIEIGIGIHTGNVVAGNVGAENRLNYTVLGANVNLASRLCSAAQGRQILISQETLESYPAKDQIEIHQLDSIVLKGFSKPVAIYQISQKQTVI